ncbi:AbiV family abortive infection protein [Aeromicrobium sp. zg-629]|nr:AbiV family abortive infection protein [Aeromicrobium senzhongii]
MSTMTASQARELWLALVDNASRLIADAHLLLKQSPGRARSLTVLAEEELGKALWLYDEFNSLWNVGSSEQRTVERFKADGRNHARKYFEAIVFGRELAMFWGDFSDIPGPGDGESIEEFQAREAVEAEKGAKAANLAKQAGFYVDVAPDGSVTSPASIEGIGVAKDLERAAKVVEMLLIRDHSRMKFEAEVPYEGTHEQQFRLLPVSHPEEFSAARETAWPGSHETPTPDSESESNQN